MTVPLRLLLVDDEPLARRALEILLRDDPACLLVGTAGDGVEALTMIAGERIDVVLADIQMPQMNGLELVEHLPAVSQPLVIFVTAHPDYAIQAFELGAVDYLMKPVAPDRLALALHRARQALSTPRSGPQNAALWRSLAERRSLRHQVDYLWADVRGGREKLAVNVIEQLLAEDDYVRIVTADRSYLVRGPLDRLATRLAGAGFLRVHRSAIVRMAAVRSVRVEAGRRLILVMESGGEVAVGRRSSALVRSALQTQG